MADLNELQSADAVRIIGSDSTGAILTPVKSNSDGSMQVHGEGVAGTPSGGIVSVQGVSGGTPIPTVQTLSVSTLNSSTTNLAAGASFTGLSETLINQAIIDVLIQADQPCSVQVEQSPDGTNWDIKDTFYVFSNIAESRTFDTAGLYWRIVVTNNGTLATTIFRLQSRLIPVGNPMPRTLSPEGNLSVALMETNPLGANAKQLFFDAYDIGLDTTNRWNTPVAVGGGVAALTNTLGYISLGTGTTANGYSKLVTQPIFKQTSPGYLKCMHNTQIEYPVQSNAYRFWGLANVATNPTATAPIVDGVGYEIATNGKMYAVTYSSGSRNVIQDLSTSGNNAQPTDNLDHKYYIFFRGDFCYWAIDEHKNVVATMRNGSSGPTANNLPITLLAVAGSTAPTSSLLLTSNGIFLGDTSGAISTLVDGDYPWRRASVSYTNRLHVMEEYSAMTYAGTTFTTVIDNFAIGSTAETKMFHLTNPSNSGKIVKINRFRLSSYSSTSGNNGAYTQWRFYIDPTITANGTATSVFGQRQNNQNASVVSTYKAPTASANGNYIRSARVNSDQMDVQVDENFSVWIEPGHSLLITFQCLSTGGTLNLDVLWSEE